MSLEQRLQKLEDEVKILKNQIQNTLLDIEAEIMSHYYTSLRAEDSPQEGGDTGNHRRRSTYDDAAAKEVSHLSSQQVRVNEAGTEDASPGASALSPTEREHPGVSGKESSRALEKTEPASAVDWDSFAKLTRWVSGTAEEIGPANTRKVIETCKAQGCTNGHMLESLLGFLSLEDDEEEASRDPVSTDRVLAALAELSQLLARES